jgi:hypothetical protein
VNSSGMLHAAGFGISTVCLPRRTCAPEIPDMKPAGRFDLYMWSAPRERRLVVLFGLPPAGFNPGLDPKPRHPAGRASRIRRWGYARRTRPWRPHSIRPPCRSSGASDG